MDFKLGLVIASAVGLVLAMMIFRPIPYDPALSCEVDADCVPEQACHPTSCISVEARGAIEPSFCTEECRPETMDCGQGSCQCINKQCGVVMNE
jgi:hypothetical protein